MRKKLRFLSWLIPCLVIGNISLAQTEFINGLSITAPPNQVSEQGFRDLAVFNANWVTLIPYGFSYPGKPRVYFNAPGQWWGECPEGIRVCAGHAREQGFRIMIKPQVWIHGDYPGGFDLETEAEWKIWERDYERYILTLAEVAEEVEAEMFCIGTEYKYATRKRDEFWRSLISKVRKVYHGKLTYAANWDNFDRVEFWGELDYIGIDAYFPLVEAKTPSITALEKAWKGPEKQLYELHKKYNKPVIFTEFGYKSTDQAAWKQWLLESRSSSEQINLKAQVNAYHALFKVFWTKPWFRGGFLWKCYIDSKQHGGKRNSDYTPEGKPVTLLISEWYKVRN